MEGMNPKYEGLEVHDVHCHADGKGFTIGWVAPKIGFGEITVWTGDEDKKLHVDTECMSDEFVGLVLSKIVPFTVREG